MRRIITVNILVFFMLSSLTACRQKDVSDAKAVPIVVISREDGSGTRAAFVELFGIDQVGSEAEITNSTAVVMASVAGNPGAIGYISLGAMNQSVQAVAIDGIVADSENIQNNTYHAVRSFQIVTNRDLSREAKDFIDFILSAEGQAIVMASRYQSKGSQGHYFPAGNSGKLVIAGSSSVTPVMEKLKEAYEKLNPWMLIEIQQSDSTTGILSVIEGVCDIGMTSRSLKAEEQSQGLIEQTIAIDGIVVITNHDNSVDNLSSDEVRAIFTGQKTSWQ